MREFFKGWRRKTGCVALIIAAALAGGWVRSREIHDRIWFAFPASLQLIYSRQGCIVWQCERPSSTNKLRLPRTKIDWLSQYAPAPGLPVNRDELLGYDVDWQWKWSQFNFGSGRYAIVDDPMEEGIHPVQPFFDRLTVWTLPYWSIIIPLTLLSACLLLTGPWQKPSAAMAEPASETGA